MGVKSPLDPYFAYVKSLMPFTDVSGITDVISANTWSGGTVSGNALTNSFTRCTLLDQSRFDLHSGDFTDEFFYTPSATDNNGSNHGLLSFSNDTTTGISYFIRYNGGLMLVSYPTAGGSAEIPVYNTTALTTGQTYHVAFVRHAGVYDLFVNGVSTVTARNNAAIPYSSSTNNLYLGILAAGGFTEYMTGKIAYYRRTAYARYIANFTPPTTPYPTH